MSRAAFSAQVFAVYVMAVGASFVVAPNMVLSLFGVPPSTEVWVHVVGVLACMIGIYAWVGGRYGHRPFLVASVGTRVLVFVAFSVFVLVGMAPPALALFGVVDLLGAVWTGLALRADAIGIARANDLAGAADVAPPARSCHAVHGHIG